jgi:hypothetical protein
MKLFSPEQHGDRQLLRQVFLGSEAGKRALGMLLFGLGFYTPAETEGTQATKNFATDLVKSLADGDEEVAMDMLISGLSGQFTMEPKNKGG